MSLRTWEKLCQSWSHEKSFFNMNEVNGATHVNTQCQNTLMHYFVYAFICTDKQRSAHEGYYMEYYLLLSVH